MDDIEKIEGDAEIMTKKSKPITSLSAQEILKLMRLPSGHPNKHGYPYSRSEMLQECQRRGKKLLRDLGWPVSPKAVYWSIHTNKPQTLEKICSPWKWSHFKHVMQKQEDELNKLTHGEFYGDFGSVGVECSTVTDWRKLLKKYPEVKEKLRGAVRIHKGFYEHNNWTDEAKSIMELANRHTECAQNILCDWQDGWD